MHEMQFRFAAKTVRCIMVVPHSLEADLHGFWHGPIEAHVPIEWMMSRCHTSEMTRRKHDSSVDMVIGSLSLGAPLSFSEDFTVFWRSATRTRTSSIEVVCDRHNWIEAHGLIRWIITSARSALAAVDCLQHHAFTDTLAERLRRRPAKPMGSPRVGSNPTGVVLGLNCDM